MYFLPTYVWIFEIPELWFPDILQLFSCPKAGARGYTEDTLEICNIWMFPIQIMTKLQTYFLITRCLIMKELNYEPSASASVNNMSGYNLTKDGHFDKYFATDDEHSFSFLWRIIIQNMVQKLIFDALCNYTFFWGGAVLVKLV